MKLNDFIHLIKGIDDGQDLPIDVATKLYNSIQKKKLAVHSKE